MWMDELPKKGKKGEYSRGHSVSLSSFLYSFIISLPSAITWQRLLLSSVGWFGCEIQNCRKSVYVSVKVNFGYISKNHQCLIHAHNV